MKTVLIVVLAAGVAFAGGCADSMSKDAAMMKCVGCKMDAPKNKMCAKDGMCATCDKDCASAMMMKCKGCSMEVSKDKMCKKCASCMKCDKCQK